MIARIARRLVARTALRATLVRVTERLRRSAFLGDDIVPYGVHAFDRGTWVIKETHAGVRVWCSLDERAISRPILLDTYERAESRFIERTVNPGDLVVDAGANIGFHALHMARRTGATGCVEAFEPLTYLADAFEASVKENGFDARVRVHRCALDERPGELRLRHAPRTANFGGGHFAPAGEAPAAHADELVATRRLDDVTGDRVCRFIKIDVEGAEPRVLRGGVATLARGRPVILAELHETQLRVVSGVSANDFIAQMGGLGYRCSRLSDDGTRGHEIARYGSDAPVNVVFDPIARD